MASSRRSTSATGRAATEAPGPRPAATCQQFNLEADAEYGTESDADMGEDPAAAGDADPLSHPIKCRPAS